MRLIKPTKIKFNNIKLQPEKSNTSNQNISQKIESYEINDISINKASYNNYTEIELLNDDSIYSEKNILYNQFGGYQGAFDSDLNYWLNNDDALKIIRTYYPEASLEEIELLFYRMGKVGCGYIALINTLMYEYFLFADAHDEEDFQRRFGFPPKVIKQDAYGNDYVDYNYELLFLDFFLYYAKEYSGFQTLEDVIGNAKEQKESNGNGDGALEDGEFVITGANGTYADEVAQVFQSYLATKGINVNICKSLRIDPNSDDYKQMVAELEKKGIEIEPGADLYYTCDYITSIINNVLKENKNMTMNVACDGFNLYSTEDLDGNGILDDVICSDVGPHAMTVVGTTSDPNKILVSSWGREFVIDASEVKEYVVIDYSEFNNNN